MNENYKNQLDNKFKNVSVGKLEQTIADNFAKLIDEKLRCTITSISFDELLSKITFEAKVQYPLEEVFKFQHNDH